MNHSPPIYADRDVLFGDCKLTMLMNCPQTADFSQYRLSGGLSGAVERLA